ncbi:MAG: hypothetical protein OXI86_07780, partial [Candidatus Poribacteria bacterium]|nr:hypothetical protein [Candidatus Poribacteria bacterium]
MTINERLRRQRLELCHFARQGLILSLNAQKKSLHIESITKKTMFNLRLKICTFVFSGLLLLNSATASVTKEEQSSELNLEMILAGIKNCDELIRSGEGKCTLTWEQSGIQADKSVWKYDFIFDKNQIRMELEESFSRRRVHRLKTTVTATSAGVWQIAFYRNRKPDYSFHTNTRLAPFDIGMEPRRWLTLLDEVPLSTYRKNDNFRIIKRENLNNTLCYVLEQKPEILSTEQTGSFDRVWISPEQGFRYLKREKRHI